MTESQLARDFVTGLGRRLDAESTSETREWWTAYLKGETVFRGARMADVRRAVADLVDELDLAGREIETLLELAQAAIAQPATEDKLGGTLLLAEHGLDRLATAHVDALAAPLAAGHLADWNSCDWYCVKLVGQFVAARATTTRARRVAGWVRSPVLWQRRAGAVAFVDLAPRGDGVFTGFVDLLLRVAAANAGDPTRWSQTSAGWLLRELSRAEPDRVRAFVDDHPELSAEARRTATARLRP